MMGISTVESKVIDFCQDLKSQGFLQDLLVALMLVSTRAMVVYSPARKLVQFT